MQVFQAQHIGKRDNQEDALLVSRGTFVVADGMGGRENGEHASAAAIGAFMGLPPVVLNADRLCGSLFRARKHIRSMPNHGDTTCTALHLAHNRALFVAHIGDSRLYRLRDGELTQVTTDHSQYTNYVMDCLAKGVQPMTQREYPYSHVLSQALAQTADIDPQVLTDMWNYGDTYVLCSDGVSDVLTEAAIARCAGAYIGDPASMLVEAAIESGGSDNASAIVVRC